ncbi:MAG: polyphosphate polymerase domain-containing protein [Eubacteriales bacterium]|nr:polyphosphate polymerase domain-containing protein [Eubacteriales bacterium]
MPVAVPLRHELKFFINPIEYQVLSRALDQVLVRDPNGDKERNEYHIRSLYFDTIFNSALLDKLNGVKDRDKYRIRIYNFSDKFIRMECKTKVGGLISKRSLAIPKLLAEQLIAGDPTGLERTKSGLLRDVYREMRLNYLRPAVIVDYVREAYLHPVEEVRITFDKQLRSGLNSHDLFNPYVPTISPFDHDEMILEVKFNRCLPPYIRDLLCTCVKSAQNSAISKYVWCRRFENFE